jgi:hypothetical protein
MNFGCQAGQNAIIRTSLTYTVKRNLFKSFSLLKSVMRHFLLLILSFLLLQTIIYGQRATRRPQPLTSLYQPATFEGHYFTVTLTNTDTVPVLLKLGPTSHIKNSDTLNLARTYPCSNPSVGEYYDLHDLVSEENNCLGWYTLQLIKPKDTLRFVIKLKDFDKSDTSRIYYCYTKEIKKVDKELNLYADSKKIYMMKDSRNFRTSFIAVDKNALNTCFAKVGLNIYLSAVNQ